MPNHLMRNGMQWCNNRNVRCDHSTASV